jgi:Membrane proteins related to metalloendopeptidases
MRWSRNKITFVLIPDASSPVRRIAVPSYMLAIGATLIPILFILLVLACLMLYRHYDANADQLDYLERKMNDTSSRYEEIVADKNTSIDYLQTKIVVLTEQASAIQRQLDDMDALEAQVRELMGSSSDEEREDEVRASRLDDSARSVADIREKALADVGMGGEDIPATDEEFQQYLDSSGEKLSSLAPTLDALEQRLQDMKDDVHEVQEKLDATPSVWPTDRQEITSRFGVRLDPFTRRARFHSGIDFSGNVGDPVYAAADGIVTWSSKDSAEGNNIKIDHGNGLVTRYLHLSKLIAEAGERVEKGDLIGELGNTGRSTGPHLHYEVIQDGTAVNPLPYLPSNPNKESEEFL